MSATSQRVRGHFLRHEGAAFDEHGRRVFDYAYGYAGGEGRGLCSCGDLSEVLNSIGQRKAWHREHKGEVLARG